MRVPLLSFKLLLASSFDFCRFSATILSRSDLELCRNKSKARAKLSAKGTYSLKLEIPSLLNCLMKSPDLSLWAAISDSS